jgi:hypothetical protein
MGWFEFPCAARFPKAMFSEKGRRMAASTPIEISTDVIASGSALAGLILVNIGGVAASYASFRPEDRPAVKCRYLLKVWFAFFGTAAAIVSVALALLAKWYGNEQIGTVSIVTLFGPVAWAMAITFFSAREVR